MLQVNIRRPSIGDQEQLKHFFRTVIIDTYTKEGIGNQVNDINEEIEMKKEYLTSDFQSNGEERYFLIAFNGDNIIGSIHYGPPNKIIKNASGHAFEAHVEIGTVFVHPDYQRNGVGNLLLKAIYETLRNKGIEEFYLDSGYKNAQLI